MAWAGNTVTAISSEARDMEKLSCDVELWEKCDLISMYYAVRQI
jgi:hypothetical protein